MLKTKEQKIIRKLAWMYKERSSVLTSLQTAIFLATNALDLVKQAEYEVNDAAMERECL